MNNNRYVSGKPGKGRDIVPPGQAAAGSGQGQISGTETASSSSESAVISNQDKTIRAQEILDPSHWNQWMAEALKNLDSSLMLEENPLSHHPYVEKLAVRKFARRFSPTGSALKEILLEGITELITEIEQERDLRRERQFLVLRLQGCKIVKRIADTMGISRTYCSSKVRRTVICLLVAKFASRVSEDKKSGR